MADTYKLYTDGSCNYKRTRATFGGYIVHPNGKIIHRFYGFVGRNRSVSEYELAGLFHGLTECINLGITSVNCFSDDESLCAVMSATNPELIKKHCKKIANRREVFDLFSKFTHVTCTYILGVENEKAHGLAKSALDNCDFSYRKGNTNPCQDSVFTWDEDIALYLNALKKVGEDHYLLGMDIQVEDCGTRQHKNKELLQKNIFQRLIRLFMINHFDQYGKNGDMKALVADYKLKLKNLGIHFLF